MNDIKQHLQKLIFLLSIPCLLIARQQDSTALSIGHDTITVSIPLSSAHTLYYLPRGYITKKSDRVSIDSLIVLTRSLDYQIDYDLGNIFLIRGHLTRFLGDSAHHRLIVQFVPLPFSFKKEYALHNLIIKRDSLGKKEVTVTQPAFRFAPEDFFEKGFQKSGSLMRGFTIGSNQDLTLNSGFRMQLNGALSNDIDVTAALTDENSPIQPEGTTQTLREVDKVFVNLRSKNLSATLGDFNLEIGQNDGGEFGRVFRKLQGASGTAAFENIGSGNLSAATTLTAATARGKFSTNYFQGVDGNQGPYRVTGKNGEPEIVVLAGTERVYLNGEVMTRGELNDYTVEYASGDITFTSRRMITNASRITVDFEYSDQQYTRNLLAVTTSETAFNEKLKFHAVLAQEADDPDSPIDFSLNDTTRNVLRNSGSDPIRASIPGIKYVGVDSIGNGRGQYLQQDTVISGKTYSILQYLPGDPRAFYSVTFSSVPAVPQDSAGYTRVASGQYKFAGIGQGNYLPIHFLPMPQLHRTLDLNAALQIAPDLSVTGEYAASRFDQNRFSPPDEQNNTGGALRLALQYKPKLLILFGKNLGQLDLSVSERYVDKAFAPLDRFNDVEFAREWNLTNPTNANEEIREASLAYSPIPTLQIGGGYGTLERTGETRSLRSHGNVNFKDSTLPVIQYNFENIANQDFVVQENSTWFRQHVSMDYHIGSLTPGVRIDNEDRTLFGSSQDSLLNGAFRIFEVAPRLGVSISGSMSASVEIQARTEDSASAGALLRASQSLTQGYNWQLSEWKNLSSTLSFNVRSVSFSEEFKRHGNVDGQFMLIRSQSRYSPLDRAIETNLYYEFASQRSSRLERVFLRVPKGTGNYIYAGDLNGNSIADDNEFQLTKYDGEYVVVYVPSTQLYPVVDLKSSVRLRFQPGRILRNASTFWENMLKYLSTETYVRVEEKSSDPNTSHIYLLNFNYFQNDKTTIAGSSQVQQDLFLFENNPDLAIRFRYNQSNGFVQLVSASERSLLKEQSVRIRSQLGREIGNQTDIVSKLDRVLSTVPSSREWDITSSSINSDFSYRPEIQWEIGFDFSVSRSVDNFEQANATANINGQGIRITYGIIGTGQLRSEFSREEVAMTNVHPDPIRGIPFELTNGSAVGKNYLWQLAFDYRINQNMQVSLQYNGRSEGGRTPVHLARAEARAFF